MLFCIRDLVIDGVEDVLGKYLGGLCIVGLTVLLIMLLPAVLDLFASNASSGGGALSASSTFSCARRFFAWPFSL